MPPAVRRFAALAGLALLLTLLFSPLARAATSGPEAPSPLTSYALAQRAPFNRPDHYPLSQRPDPALYRPHADWIGRLVLPSPQEIEAARGGPQDPGDWVWVVLEQAPASGGALVGRRLRLRWQDTPALRSLVDAVTTDVRFGAAADAVARQGNVLPRRLDGRRRVGPLQSLAGARPNDDVIVALEAVELEPLPGGGTDLRIGRPPLQITGRWEGLVEILGPVEAGSERFRVRHYNRASGGFDGPITVIRLPQQPRDRFGRQLSSPRGIATSAVGAEGWYVFGAPDAEGLFTVQAIRPRALLRLTPDRVIEGTERGLRHIAHGNWADTPAQRGRIARVRLGADRSHWRLGDRALLLHSFGGIGGPGGEPISGFTVTGHFAFGEARVVRDAFTGEPRFDLRYHQIYANNPNGIVSGTQDWTAFTGDLQRGWLGTRPISDLLVRLPAFDDVRSGERRLSLLEELAIQAEVLMARYRSGDGTGVSTVTPSTSCVQDSSQALFIAIAALRRERAGADTAGTRQLKALADALDALLQPFGTVRSDWQRNAAVLTAARVSPAAAGDADPFVRGERLRDAALSWRSMLPRRAHDDFAATLLRHGGALWFLRTNQLPGADPTLLPLAPTLLLGQIPLLSTLLRRFTDALFTPLGGSGWAIALALLGAYAALALPLGLRSGFLASGARRLGPAALLRLAAGLLPMPALGEELLFRVALLPHPLEGASLGAALGWGMLSVGLFVLYHPLAGASWYPAGRRVFRDPRFLLQCALLGIVCVLAYRLTGSLWPPVLIHWLAVVVWLGALGGREHLVVVRPTARASG